MRRRAFTLIELLVVVAIIALLIAILIPTLGKAREQALKATCAANLSGHGKAMSIYSSQFNDVMPLFASAATTGLNQEPAGWADDLIAQPSATGNVIAKWFFCPSNNAMANNGGTTLGYSYMNQRVYINDLFNPGTTSLPTITPGTNATPRVNPPFTYHRNFLNNQFAASSELGLDTIFNTTSGVDFSVTTTTNHMASDTYPSGANVLYFDGHVKWQKFGGGTGANPLPTVSATDPLNRVVLLTSSGYFYFPAP